jgi:hypothetical protein
MDRPMRDTLPSDLRERLEKQLKAMKEKPDDRMDDNQAGASRASWSPTAEGGDVSITVGGVTHRIRDHRQERGGRQASALGSRSWTTTA